MKLYVFIAFLVTLILGTYWGYREWMGPSDEPTVSTETEGPKEDVREPAAASAGSQFVAPTAGALAPGQVPGPRDGDSAPSTSGASGTTADLLPNENPDLNAAGFPKHENTRADGRLDLGDDDPSALNRNPDPFQPEAASEMNAFSDLPPPPPPRVAEEGAGEPVDAYDGGSENF